MCKQQRSVRWRRGEANRLREKELEKEDFEPDGSVLRGRLNNTDSLEKLHTTLVHLSPLQSVELISLLQSFPELFGDTPT